MNAAEMLQKILNDEIDEESLTEEEKVLVALEAESQMEELKNLLSRIC